ncbi:MAG: hypothetical protein LBD03_08870 [Methanobrevibacter sp.]|nr:hypothetical protein [Candidatus Methanovirga procula]
MISNKVSNLGYEVSIISNEMRNLGDGVSVVVEDNLEKLKIFHCFKQSEKIRRLNLRLFRIA